MKSVEYNWDNYCEKTGKPIENNHIFPAVGGTTGFTSDKNTFLIRRFRFLYQLTYGVPLGYNDPQLGNCRLVTVNFPFIFSLPIRSKKKAQSMVVDFIRNLEKEGEK